jgi:membrane-bound lytic murein transglycosylase B
MQKRVGTEDRAAIRQGRSRRLPLLAFCGLLAASTAQAAPSPASWSYLIDRLVRDGIRRDEAVTAFSDPRVPAFDRLEFALQPRESSSMYLGFRSSQSLAGARTCRARHRDDLLRAEARHGVPASVVSAIIHVETHCGKNRGKDVVLYRLARLAMANEPVNVRRNIIRHTEDAPASRHAEIEATVRRRARYLEDTFYPEVVATFRLARRARIDPLGIRGSGAGAFGIPQFLPSSYLAYAVDGNGDGRVSLHDEADAIHSAARYLASHGWRANLSRAEQRKVIWAYNRSDAYIDTVLYLAERIEESHPSDPNLRVSRR